MNLTSHFKKIGLISFLIFGFINQVLAITEGAKTLVLMETRANAAGFRSNAPVKMYHVEIPLKLMSVDFARRLDPKIAQSLVFEKEGQKYVRWILNPEDTKWGKELLEYFKVIHNLDLVPKEYFIGYKTASRSYIAENPENGALFSVKSSTNNTGGAWRDKKQPVGEAVDGRLLSDYLAAQNRKRKFESFMIMDEPAILKVTDVDQAVVIRDIGSLKSADNKFYYLPGFSVLHDKVGSEIARRNGSDDPYRYWTEHYVKVAGKALGELAARTGLQFDSPHSQNFLVEMDANLKPTGRLVLRDMSDIYVDTNFIKAIYGDDAKLLAKFSQKENLLPGIAAGFGPLHGNIKPSWVDEFQYSDWNMTFFKEFEKSFLNISGYDLKVLRAKKIQNKDYFSANYKLGGNQAFERFFRMLRAEGVVRNFGGALRCQYMHSAAGI